MHLKWNREKRTNQNQTLHKKRNNKYQSNNKNNETKKQYKR